MHYVRSDIEDGINKFFVLISKDVLSDIDMGQSENIKRLYNNGLLIENNEFEFFKFLIKTLFNSNNVESVIDSVGITTVKDLSLLMASKKIDSNMRSWGEYLLNEFIKTYEKYSFLVYKLNSRTLSLDECLDAYENYSSEDIYNKIIDCIS